MMFPKLLRLQTRLAAREAGYGFFEINQMMGGCDDAKVAEAVDLTRGMGYAVPADVVTPVVGAIGDGTILKKIVEFLQSDTGKMLIQILLSLLMAL